MRKNKSTLRQSFSGKISYLAYPDFEADPHPALLTCVKLNMRSRQIDFYDYRQSENPPVLHRKETFLPPTHPLFPKFARLTRQEEAHGLPDESGCPTNDETLPQRTPRSRRRN